MTGVEKFHAAMSECSLHAMVLQEALAGWQSPPFTADTVTSISTAQRRLLDQLAYRFGKLQDTLGEKVLPALLDLAEEPFSENATFAEKLQRLERMGAIDSVDGWRELRELRNQIAHEYVEQPAIKAAALNRFLTGIPQLLTFWERIEDFAQRHLVGREGKHAPQP